MKCTKTEFIIKSKFIKDIGDTMEQSTAEVLSTMEASKIKEAADALANEIIEDIERSNEHTIKCHGKDCVILIGDTGVGKSTLANALVYGSKCLKELEIMVEDEEFGTYPDTVIVVKEEYDDNSPFGIGHKINESYTKHPITYENAETNLVIADCPGFGDTSGCNRDIVNCVGINNILRKAKTIRVLVAISAQ